MSTMGRPRLSHALAAAALAALFAGPAAGQTPVHGHDGAAAIAQLQLNQGSKWATDAPLRAGMARIRALVEPHLAAADAGPLGPTPYRGLAKQIESEVGVIVANCKLEPKADAMLHLVIADIVSGANAIAGRNAEVAPARGLVKVALAVNAYADHFDHPGFQPIRGAH